MSMILGYIKEREISFLFFLLLVLLVIVLWNLYKKEKKRAEAAELSVAGERKYYVVCIPSSRQLKKYKIFVLPGVYRATFLCRQSLLFMKFHWC